MTNLKEEQKIDILDLDKAAVLAALYNRAKSLGLGFIHYTPEDMSIEEAQKLLDSGQTYFDYVNGRVMKINLAETSFDPWLYDRDNGHHAALQVINTLRMDN